MTDNLTDYFDIGEIVNVHGIRGELKILPITDDPSRFELLDEVEIFSKTGSVKYPLEKVRLHKSLVFLKLKGIDDRNAAEELKRGIIKIPRSQALPLEDDEYYQSDLLDMTVETDKGEELGYIAQIIETGANDVYVVRPPDGGKDLLIPAIKACILSVSVTEKKMIVHLIKGLREL